MKNCLAFIGFLSLVLVLLLGALFFFLYAGQGLPSFEGVPFLGSQPTQIIQVNPLGGNAVVEKKSLIDQLPLPIPIPTSTPVPTATPIPDPVVYQSEVMLRARQFATALDSFDQVNAKLSQSPALAKDSAWQSEMQTNLDALVATAQALGQVQPVPDQDQAIQTWLQKVGEDTLLLQQNYLNGIENGSQQSLQAAGDNMNSIREDMLQAQAETVKAGWKP